MVSCLFVIFHWVCSYHLSLLRTFFGSCLSSDEIVIFSMLTPLADGISTWCYLFLSLSKVKQTPLSQTDSLLMLLPSLHPRVLAIDTHALCLKFSDATLQSPMYLMLGIIRFLKCPSCPCFPHSYFSSCSSVSAPVFLLCLAQQLLGLHKFCFSTSWSVGFGGPALWLVVSHLSDVHLKISPTPFFSSLWFFGETREGGRGATKKKCFFFKYNLQHVYRMNI